MTSYAIQFCYLPNSIVQNIDMKDCKRSEFQIKTLYDISQRDDFAYFVTMQDVGRTVIVAPEFTCAFHVMWYDKAGNYHSAKIGRRKILEDYSGLSKQPAATLNSQVYYSRCRCWNPA